MGDGGIRVLLVDDHAMVREGLRALLVDAEGIEPIGGAGDGMEAVERSGELRPDVVVMDVTMPGLDGIEATRRIRQSWPEIGVVVLSMYDDAATVDRALRAGARGYVLKGGGVQTLCAAIRAVSRGGMHIDEGVSEAVLGAWLGGAPVLDPLTDREREVLRLIADGFTSAEVAGRMGLKTKTVQNYRGQIMDKLGIHTTAGLVRYALRAGLTR